MLTEVDSSVHHVTDPSTAITEAAYLLFYRRRSTVPLGGSRFGVISEQYADESEADGDEAEAGEGQGLGEGSSLTGSPSALTGAGAVRHQASRGLDRVTITALTDADDDDALPPYEEGPSRIETIQNSIEDEGVDVEGAYQPLTAASLVTQNWNFEALGNSGAEDSTGADFASDDVQLSSSEMQTPGQDFEDHDTEMTGTVDVPADHQAEPPAPDDSAQAALADIQTATWANQGIISVAAAHRSDSDSNEVTEIHLDTEKTSVKK